MTSFNKLSEIDLPTLRATVACYRHPNGARHVHLANDQEELAFVVGFPTLPLASDGRAHILEHLALCGSERFPVADPFFAMLSRSTALFMNAMTYPDRTIYPFATTDRRDFANLLDVYLDATFFPRLDYLSFRQEGWRYGLDGNKLEYQGVVFNEMKGTLSDPMGVLHRGIFEQLFEGTTYACNSGGDPLSIVKLGHEELVKFHAEHYHPSQAVFLTSGRLDLSGFHETLEAKVIAKRPGRVEAKSPGAANEAVARTVSIKVPTQGRPENDHSLQIAWRLGERTDLLARHRLMLFGRAMFGNASAPGLRGIESSGLGRPSQLTGFDDSARQMVFHMGIQGLASDQLDAAREVLWGTLVQAAANKPQMDDLLAGIRDLRLQQREVKGGSVPDGLSRLIAAAPVVMYGDDVASAFDNERVLQALEAEVSGGDFVSRMAQALMDDPNRVVVHAVPDPEFASRRFATEASMLAVRQEDMTPSDIEAVRAESLAITAHRKARSDNSVLPKIRPQDLSPEPRSVPLPIGTTSEWSLYQLATNGLAYGTVMFELGSFDPADWPWLALYSDLLLDLGVEGSTYEEASAWRYRMVPSAASSMDVTEEGVPPRLVPRLSIHARHLATEGEKMIDVIEAWATRPRFDELARIEFLVKTWLDEWVSRLADASRQFAEWDASASYSASRNFLHHARGLGSLEFVRQLRALASRPTGAAEVAERLGQIHARLRQSPRRVLWTSSESGSQYAEALSARTTPESMSTVATRPIALVSTPVNNALRVVSQVNHCYATWQAPSIEHEDSAGLAVTAELLRHKILHRRLREEGGAYGGAANYSPEDRVFSMSSFRDPRLTETHKDMAEAVRELLLEDYAQEAVDEAIVSVVKGLDRPLQPAAQAFEAERLARRGITLARRKEFRARVMRVTKEHVSRASAAWLNDIAPSRSAAVGSAIPATAGLHLIELAID